MRRAFALVLASAFSGLACRQIAGIEDIQPSRPALDAGAACDCPGCTVLAVGLGYPVSILRAGKDLYVADYGRAANKGSIVRVSTDGGAVETFLPDLDHPSALATDGTVLFWMAEDGKGHGLVERRAISGGLVVTVAGGLGVVPLLYQSFVQFPTDHLFALTDTTVYFASFSANGRAVGIGAAPRAGGAPTQFVADHVPDGGAVNPIVALAMVTDGVALTFIDNNRAFAGILRAPLPTGSLAWIASNLVGPVDLAVDGDRILFLDVGLSAKNGTLDYLPSDGGAPTLLLDKLVLPWSLAVDQGFVYLTSLGFPTGGSILKVGVDGGSATTIVAKTPQAVGFVLDETYIYWVDPICKTVMKAPK